MYFLSLATYVTGGVSASDATGSADIAFWVSIAVLTYWALNFFNKGNPSRSFSQLCNKLFKTTDPPMQTDQKDVKPPVTRHIWQYWDQTENPKDVLPAARVMMESVQAANPNWEYHYVSRYNLWDFLERGVDLPAHFNELEWSKIACKADVVRVALLKKYGGIYADASIISLKNFDCLWEELENSSQLEYVGFLNKAPVEKGFEWSVWFMMSKAGSKLMTEWHNAQLQLLQRLTHTKDDGTLEIRHEHPMYLDFGHACLDILMEEFQKSHPETLSIHTAIGCWSSEADMGKNNWALYNRILNDLLPRKPDDVAANHIHFYRQNESDELPAFVKLHRANKQGGTYEDWLNKPGPWLDSIKRRAL